VHSALPVALRLGLHMAARDIALYGYTQVAGESSLDLSPYRALRQWLARVQEQPGHVTIDHWQRHTREGTHGTHMVDR
jgi:hypothetical protein